MFGDLELFMLPPKNYKHTSFIICAAHREMFVVEIDINLFLIQSVI